MIICERILQIHDFIPTLDPNGVDYEFGFNNLPPDEIYETMKTEPTKRKPYPVVWLEHSENIQGDCYNNYEKRLHENKFDLETFSTDRLCEDYLQSDTTGKCFLIVRDSWGRQFLEKKIETSKMFLILLYKYITKVRHRKLMQKDLK